MTATFLPLALAIAVGWPGGGTIQAPAVPKEVRDLEGNCAGTGRCTASTRRARLSSGDWTDTLKATGGP